MQKVSAQSEGFFEFLSNLGAASQHCIKGIRVLALFWGLWLFGVALSRAGGRTKLSPSLPRSVLIRLVISHVVPATESGVGDKWVSSSHEE